MEALVISHPVNAIVPLVTVVKLVAKVSLRPISSLGYGYGLRSATRQTNLPNYIKGQG